MFIKHYLIAMSTGTSAKGMWHKLTILTELTDEVGKTTTATCDYFVDESIFAQVKGCAQFTEIDAVLMPTSQGRVRLISALPL